ncbi:MAG: helix-turn-helix transcriptional regulator [Clostridia bacterium]|nr:helix-turn-helix transcriptional regulator [Clostridia bacterium]
MYTNYAYIGENDEDIVDITKPLIVTAAGYNRVVKRRVIATERPNGRGDFQIIYIASGKAHFFLDGEEQIVSRGNIVLFRPWERQMYYYYLEDRVESYWIHFTGYEAEKLLDTADLSKNVFFIGDSSDFPSKCNRIIREIQTKRTNYEDLTSILFREIILVISRYLREGQGVNRDTLNEVERAINYFSENYTEDINIEQYAKMRHMSVSWFIRNFKSITKLSPLQYIIALRITNAKALLINTDYPISKISDAVGFDNALYFSRLFHKHTGMSPMKFRKRN